MTESNVRSILGEPDKVDVNRAFSRWEYPGGGYAEFSSRDGLLSGWSEPR
jgi:hypothetical protein